MVSQDVLTAEKQVRDNQELLFNKKLEKERLKITNDVLGKVNAKKTKKKIYIIGTILFSIIIITVSIKISKK